MEMAAGKKVPFTRQNAKKCLCWECPVQSDSKCIAQNSEKVGDVLTTSFFEPKLVPGLYCSSGVAACGDIEPGRSCICGACAVYGQYRLGNGQPIDHFCAGGSAR